MVPRPRLVIATAALAAALGFSACGGSEHSAQGAPPPPADRAAAPATGVAAASGPRDWTRFGFDAARTGDSPLGLSSDQIGRLHEHRVRIDGTVDSAPVYLSRIRVRGRAHDLLVMTTTYGRTLGLDAASGAVLWRFTPSSYRSVRGSYRITNASPIVDPSRRFVFTASPDGHIHKLRVSNGREVRAGPWPTAITRDARHEKITSSLNIDGRYLLATTGGYIGDAPPYQGKVVAIDRGSGRIKHVFNSLCSNRRSIIRPSSCRSVESAIWPRAGAVVDPVTHAIFTTSSNGPFNGSTDWGDSVLELAPAAVSLRLHYTPSNQRALENSDSDLGSTAPALLPDPAGDGTTRFLLQGGKDGKLRLLDVSTSLHAVSGAAGRRLGGEVQTLALPGGADTMFTAPAVLHRPGLTQAFVATSGGTTAYSLVGGRLRVDWKNGSAGTTPVLAGGLLWVYDPDGGLNVYRPESGARVRHLAAPSGHWNSPIVAGGRVYLPTGNANDHATRGELSIYR